MPSEGNYDAIRAASYLLQTIAVPDVWPFEYFSKLVPLLEKSIWILENMINPPNEEDWFFLYDWDNDPDVIVAVKAQIDALKANLDSLG